MRWYFVGYPLTISIVIRDHFSLTDTRVYIFETEGTIGVCEGVSEDGRRVKNFIVPRKPDDIVRVKASKMIYFLFSPTSRPSQPENTSFIDQAGQAGQAGKDLINESSNTNATNRNYENEAISTNDAVKKALYSGNSVIYPRSLAIARPEPEATIQSSENLQVMISSM